MEQHPKLAMTFPGQGSQTVGMIKGYQDAQPPIMDLFDRASEVLKLDLWGLIQHGPEEKLNQTCWTQPALLVSSYAIYEAFCAQTQVRPSVLAGHSLGEYTALVAAGVLSLEQAVRIVHQRGLFMQEAVPEGVGAMAAVIGLDIDTLEQGLIEAAEGDVLEAVNFNAPGQIVIAGHKNALERATPILKAKGAKRVLGVPVSVPSHSSLMKPASIRLGEFLETMDFHAPKAAVINNVDVTVHNEVEAIKQALVRQLHSPVQWIKTIESMKAQGISTLIECGPGKVLTGLAKRIDPSIKGVSIETPELLEQTLSQWTEVEYA